MATAVHVTETAAAQYYGLRMTADEYLQLPQDGHRYELVDGVVLVSPSSTPRHQAIVAEILYQLASYLRDHPVGMALPEVDIRLGKGPAGGDLVYRPDAVFIRREHLAQIEDRIETVPDLVVEVVSQSSGRYDRETKKDDYERHGVLEYWLVDMEQETLVCYRLVGGRYVKVERLGDTLTSQAVPGFTLDLARVHKLFKPWR